ncbi:hypothetical protein [Microlunatus speluncae]|uniref:hypothetical protein n=1 Tax=Microlunatus speluncae TaxID=2594267 RepID=UPI001266092F|nr:hypothetical protein [Microlunatus speluncae]
MDGTGYEERYGLSFGEAIAFGAGVAAAVGGLGILATGHPAAFALAIPFLLFGVGSMAGVVYVAIVQWGKPALRVDHEGVHFGRRALGNPERLIRWAEIGSIVLFRSHKLSLPPQRYLGLDGRGRPVPVPELRGLDMFGASHVSHVSHWVAMCSRPISGWELDKGKLRLALARYAPDVELIDLD